MSQEPTPELTVPTDTALVESVIKYLEEHMPRSILIDYLTEMQVSYAYDHGYSYTPEQFQEQVARIKITID